MAGVVVVLVVCVVVPFWEDIWVTMAYEQKPMKQSKHGFSSGMYYLEKRSSWIPGQRYLVPPQVCGGCLGRSSNRHAACWARLDRARGRRAYFLNRKRGGPALTINTSDGDSYGERADVWEMRRWYCTCRDSNHRCKNCRHGQHSKCRVPRDGPNCPCPDPSHKDKP